MTENYFFTHYAPLLREEMNGRLGQAKFDLLRILLDSGESSSIILDKHAKIDKEKYQ